MTIISVCTSVLTYMLAVLQPGDKIVKVSASFGNDIWDAINYGQVMYAIKTRNGQVYMKLQSNGGDTSVMQVSQPQTVCASDRCLCSDCLYGSCTATLLHHCHCTCGWLLRRCTATSCKSVDYMHIVVDLTTACPHLLEHLYTEHGHKLHTQHEHSQSRTS